MILDILFSELRPIYRASKYTPATTPFSPGIAIMKSLKIVAIAIALSVSLSACASGNGYGSSYGGQDGVGAKQVVGLLGGAALGGFLGSKVGKGNGKLAAVAAGTVLGALTGNSIGRSLDRADESYAKRATGYALAAEVGEPITWQNPRSNHSGVVATTAEGIIDGRHCKQFVHIIQVGSLRQENTGIACRQHDGQWVVQP